MEIERAIKVGDKVKMRGNAVVYTEQRLCYYS